MKTTKRILLLLSVILLLVIIINYPKLNIISGYAAKNTSSSIFVANRTAAFTDATDNNFSPINLASTAVSLEDNFASASTLGLLTRKAVYRNGLGSVLITKGYDASKKELIPKRFIRNTSLAYPFVNKPQKDTLFNTINYEKLD